MGRLGADGGVGDAVGHDELGGEALAGLADLVFFSQEPAVRVIVQIDEAGRNDLAGGVDYLGGCGAGEVANGSDAIALDADIPAAARRAVAIYDSSTCDDDIVQGSILQ